MDPELNSEGVCCTCSLRSKCLSFKNSKISGRPILHCEEFDDLSENAVGEKQRGGPWKGIPATPDRFQQRPGAVQGRTSFSCIGQPWNIQVSGV